MMRKHANSPAVQNLPHLERVQELQSRRHEIEEIIQDELIHQPRQDCGRIKGSRAEDRRPAAFCFRLNCGTKQASMILATAAPNGEITSLRISAGVWITPTGGAGATASPASSPPVSG